MPVVQRAFIFCGDREWKDFGAIQLVLNSIPPQDTAIITGGARGADTIAWQKALNGGFRAIRMDAPWEAFDKYAGPMRNQWMLDLLLAFRELGADVFAHAFHANISSSKGTADMLGRLRKAGVTYTIHDGR